MNQGGIIRAKPSTKWVLNESKEKSSEQGFACSEAVSSRQDFPNIHYTVRSI